ncbi:MAG: serine/threonine-protein kinase [Myxococcota bacterium]
MCGRVHPIIEPGDRCPDHPDSVLVPISTRERFPDDHVLGRVVAGKYAVFSVLGMGGFGAVYRAIQEPVGRAVALKVVHKHNADDPELRARFFREAKMVARLKDPAVVTLHDYGDDDELGLYMVFELVEGRSLSKVVKQGPQDPARVVHILLQLLRALAEAHSRGMVHRDLKPANIMLVESQTDEVAVRLLDFGIAKDLAKDDAEKSLQTQRGLVMGTPRYLSPEQARAAEQIDHRTDLYSLGVIAYALLTGTNPFARESVIDTIMAHCTVPPPPMAPELMVPPMLEAAIGRALEKEPDDRYASAEAMAEALQASLPHVAFPTTRWRVRAISSDLVEDDAAAYTPSSSRLSAQISGAASMMGQSAGHADASGGLERPGTSGRGSASQAAPGFAAMSEVMPGGMTDQFEGPSVGTLNQERRPSAVWLALLFLLVGSGGLGAWWFSQSGRPATKLAPVSGAEAGAAERAPGLSTSAPPLERTPAASLDEARSEEPTEAEAPPTPSASEAATEATDRPPEKKAAPTRRPRRKRVRTDRKKAPEPIKAPPKEPAKPKRLEVPEF